MNDTSEEAAKMAESKARHFLNLESHRIQNEIDTLLGELDRLEEDWAKKYGKVNQLSKLNNNEKGK